MRNKQQQSVHYEFIKKAIPEWFVQSAPHRVHALKLTVNAVPTWSKTASTLEHASLKRATEAGWRAQNDVDRMLGEQRDVYAFAEPLLTQALKDQYAIEVDVRETFLKLYSPVKLSPWAHDFTGGVSSRTVSLLDAALHNFAIGEVLLPDSQFITRPDKRGQFEIKNIQHTISIEQFKTLCRELNIGARYTQHLEEYLRPSDGLARGVLQSRIIKSQQTALKAAAHLALMKKDIGTDGFLAVEGLLKGIKGQKLDGVPVRYYHLTMLDTRLKGIVLIAADLESHRGANRRVIAYVPHDPEHPVKEYPSLLAFSHELIRQLRAGPGYLRFFSRFVDHQKRGAFFSTLAQHLGQADNPRMHFGVTAFESDTENRFNGNVWVYLYQQQLNKILNDARELVISTADADRMERWAWFDNLEKMLGDVLNAALLVVTPFIPGLGEVMMGYMVYQLLSEVVEGVVDLAEGLYLEAAEHLIGFTESLVQLGTFAVGMQIAGGTLVPKLSSFIEGTKLVTLADGSQRLWSQNLDPYLQENLRLVADSKPDAQGLHQHEGDAILRIDTRHFKLEKDPRSGQHRVRHATRPEAYQPLVHSNGDGAFVIEGEQPHTWNDASLMARLGPDMGRVSDVYGDIRLVSRTDAAAIRRMFVDHERSLPLLSDTVTRFQIDRDIQTFMEQIGSDHAQQYLQADPVIQFQLLKYLWEGRSFELIGADGDVLESIGSTGSPEQIDINRLTDGDVLKTWLAQLDDAEIRSLMNDEFGKPPQALNVTSRRLRAELAQLARRHRNSLFSRRYKMLEQGRSDDVRNLMGFFDTMPGSVAQEMLSVATAADRSMIAKGQLPPGLRAIAAGALQEVRVCRAYEGLFLDSVDNPDTDRLVLHSLERLRGWNPDVRLAVTRAEYDGPLLDSIGADDAAIRRTLVEREDSIFQACDDEGNTLHTPGDLYSAILQALPDAERDALNIHIGEAPRLKQAIRDRALQPYRLQTLLSERPPLKPVDPQTMRLRGGGPKLAGERAQLQETARLYENLVFGAFGDTGASVKSYDFLRGLALMQRDFNEVPFYALQDALIKANLALDAETNAQIVESIEVLPELEALLLPEQFDDLAERLFTEDGLVPLSQEQRNLGINARHLERTGRTEDYQALMRTVREHPEHVSQPWAELGQYSELLFTEVVTPDEPIEVSPQTMSNLKLAQRAVCRAKELLPLSGNQLPSIWEKGGSAIAKIKGLREMNLQEGGFTAKLSVAEAARKAIDIKGGNCSENSKVTFSILASQPRSSKIHIVKATEFDHQYVVIGDDLSNLEQLVVADSWPEFPAAHLASKGRFNFELPPLVTLDPGPGGAEFAFIDATPPGQATLPEVSRENTFRQIKINRLYKEGAAYAQYTSLNSLGNTYVEPEGLPVSFEWLPASVIEGRVGAYVAYSEAFKAVKAAEAE